MHAGPRKKERGLERKKGGRENGERKRQEEKERERKREEEMGKFTIPYK